MQKLSFQDAFFLRAESPNCPFHVASLMILSPPPKASADYFRKLAQSLGQLNELWPVFGRRLKDPDNQRSLYWIEAEDYDPNDHVLHYRLPKKGNLEDLLTLTARAHEQVLDRTRPLWQVHLIEGLPGKKFAIYFKVHHALVDGVGGLKMIREMFSTNPEAHLQHQIDSPKERHTHDKGSLTEAFKHSLDVVLKQSRAVSEASNMLLGMGLDSLLGKKDRPQIPFSAPRSLFNQCLDTRRRFIVTELPINTLHEIGKHHGGTINDVLVAICGSALREYLLDVCALPKRSLDAGLPVSIKGVNQAEGNQLSFIICPFATDEKDPVKRLRLIIKATRKAKWELAHMSAEGNEDLATMTMIPFLLLSLTHTSQRVPPVFNAIVSNVPGSKEQLFFEGAKLESLYPLSIVTDGMGLNITAISYADKLCLGLTCAPGSEPFVESLGDRIQQGFKTLSATLKDGSESNGNGNKAGKAVKPEATA